MFAVAVLALAGLMIAAAALLGPKRRGRADPHPFESGILPIHDTHIRVPIQFYLIAVFFVLFDLEMVFVFAWAVAARSAGWTGYGGIMAFLILLLAALGYLWRDGALDWGPATRARMAPPRSPR